MKSVIKKISLNKGIEEDELEALITDFFKQLRGEMAVGNPKIMIHNFASFVLDKKKMKHALRICNYMQENGRNSPRIEEIKEFVENNIDKITKQTRC